MITMETTFILTIIFVSWKSTFHLLWCLETSILKSHASLKFILIHNIQKIPNGILRSCILKTDRRYNGIKRKEKRLKNMEDIKGVIRAVSRRTNNRMSKDKRYNAEGQTIECRRTNDSMSKDKRLNVEGQTIECRRTNDRMSNKRKETNNDL